MDVVAMRARPSSLDLMCRECMCATLRGEVFTTMERREFVWSWIDALLESGQRKSGTLGLCVLLDSVMWREREREAKSEVVAMFRMLANKCVSGTSTSRAGYLYATVVAFERWCFVVEAGDSDGSGDGGGGSECVRGALGAA